MIYFLLGFIYLKYLYNLFVQNEIIKSILIFLAFPTLIISPLIIQLTENFYLTTSFFDEALFTLKTAEFNFVWILSIISFIFFFRFVPCLWIFDKKEKVNFKRNLILKVHFPFRASLIIFGIGFMISLLGLLAKLGSNYNNLVFDRDILTKSNEENLLQYGRGFLNFVSTTFISVKLILISHIIHIQKIKKIYTTHQYKILVFSFIGTFLLDYLINLSFTSSRIGMSLPLIVIFFQYKYAFSSLKLNIKIIKFRLSYLFGILAVLLTPLLFSFLSFFRSGKLPNNFDFLLNTLHGLSGFMTISEFAVIFNLVKNGKLNLQYGYSFFLDIFQFIPRFLYTDKPITSFSYRMSQEIYNLSYDDPSTWVHTFTPWGEGYLQFSIIGVILASLILVSLIKISISFVNKYRIFTFNFLFLYLPSFATTFRADLSAAFGRFYEFLFFSILGYFFLISIFNLLPMLKTKTY